jgi:hypothetical protein
VARAAREQPEQPARRELAVVRSAVSGILQRLVSAARANGSRGERGEEAYADSLRALAELAEDLAGPDAADRLARIGLNQEQLEFRISQLEDALADTRTDRFMTAATQGRSLFDDLSREFIAAMRPRAYLESLMVDSPRSPRAGLAEEGIHAPEESAHTAAPSARKPLVYIGHTQAGKRAAELLHARLASETESSLEEILTGETRMEQLEKGATKVEYAVFVLDPGESGEADDEMRKACLEFGYFMGKLGRPKTFIVVPKSHVDDLPTPLSTLGSVAYDDTRTDRDLPQALTQAATNIRERILEQEQRRHGG